MKTKDELNERRYGTKTPNKFDILRQSIIIGVIDERGVAHSELTYYENMRLYEDAFPFITTKRWRWDFDKCVTTSIYADTFEDGDGDIIRNHLRREYGIRFYENGHHDIEYFIGKMSI